MQRRPLFSLIISTLGRDVELEVLLRSLVDQTMQDFEVLIVDQNRSDKIVAIIDIFLSKLDIQHICHIDKGLSKARNEGLRRARGKFITFPDDDCYYNPYILEEVLKVFDANPHVDGISGRYGCKITGKNAWRLSRKKQYIGKYNIFRTLIEFSLFFRSTCLQDIFFDEDMGVGASTPWWSDEGPDLMLRLINRGGCFLYCPEILIYHPDPIQHYDAKTILRAYRYGNGRGWFLRKHNYPFWFVGYSWGLYVVGIGIGIFQFNTGKIKYYWSGLKGRVRGYMYAAS